MYEIQNQLFLERRISIIIGSSLSPCTLGGVHVLVYVQVYQYSYANDWVQT